MNNYRDDFRKTQREYYWSLPRVIIAAIAAVALIGVASWALGLLSQGSRVVSKTFDADNIINNYEWYHDAHNSFLARTGQIKQFKGFLAEPSDSAERGRIRIELAAVQQACRDLVGRYNANATKSNRAIFMGKSAPSGLSMEACE